jgi:hypothetical protein
MTMKILRARADFADAQHLPRLRLFLSCFTVLLTLASPAWALPPAAEQRLTKLAPESILVPLENGSGVANVILVVAAGVGVPSFKVTSAVGSSNAIPSEQFKFNCQAEPKTNPNDRTLLNCQLRLDAKVNVEPAATYTGRIIGYWPDAEQSLDFTVSDRTSLEFSLAPARLDLTLDQFQPDTVTVRVRNTGKSNIDKLTITSSNLLDSETQHRVELAEVVKDLSNNPLRPMHDVEVSFKIPRPKLAGSYAGTLDVVAEDGQSRQSIPLVLRSRGPIPAENTYFIPFILFGATLILGFALSTKLENWLNLGGLQRAEAVLSLQKSEQELARLSLQVEQWGAQRPPEVFGNTRVRLQLAVTELRELIERVANLTQEQLVAEAQRFAHAEAHGRIFESAVKVALQQWPTQEDKLNAVLTKLDGVEPSSDLNAYRESLRKVLEEAAKQDEIGASADNVRPSLPDLPAIVNLKNRIKFMSHLQSALVAVVVFIVAYQLFYARDFTFGKLLDYLQVFLWSLGLTQAGSQILARARSTFTPS